MRALCISQRAGVSAQVRAIRLLVDRHEEVAPATVVPALQACLPHCQSTLPALPTLGAGQELLTLLATRHYLLVYLRPQLFLMCRPVGCCMQ